MIDFEEIQRRAKAAAAQASQNLNDMQKRSAELQSRMAPASQEPPKEPDTRAETAQAEANQVRQVEILGQVFGADDLARMAANQDQLQQMMQAQMAQAAAFGAESALQELLGEDMGVIAAALETLSMEVDDDEEDEPAFDPEQEQSLYTLLEETMARIDSLPEPEPEPYGRDMARWERFGILLSGIVSTLNDHRLDGMDVEEHSPVMEQQVVSIVRRSWGISGRSDLLDTIRYLTREGYRLRYQLYTQAVSPEELLDEDADEEEREATARAWRFAQRYKDQYAPGFMTGWDIGRAAMLARWGCFIGWLTESEATGILWDLAQEAAEALHGWREFAQSYLFGGLMWKLLCGDCSAASYLGYVADAAADLIAGEGGQWKGFPWPAQRKIGFMAE